MNSEVKILVITADALEGQTVRRVLGAEGFSVELSVDRAEAGRKYDMGSFDIVVAEAQSLSEMESIGNIAPSADVIAIMSIPEGQHSIGRPINPRNIVETAHSIMARRLMKARGEIIAQQGAYLSHEAQGLQEYEDGLLLKKLDGGGMELCIDIGPWSSAGKMLCVEFTGQEEKLIKGEPFARLFTAEGETRDLIAPFDGSVSERNGEVNSKLCVLMRECPTEGCVLWLIRALV
jgi:hypothetical protein